jgi:hypothetical protein
MSAMPRGGGIHTVPDPDGAGWVNEEGGRILTRHRWKYTAVARGRRLAITRSVEHTIHDRAGCIRQKNSYGKDPCPPVDKG